MLRLGGFHLLEAGQAHGADEYLVTGHGSGDAEHAQAVDFHAVVADVERRVAVGDEVPCPEFQPLVGCRQGRTFGRMRIGVHAQGSHALVLAAGNAYRVASVGICHGLGCVVERRCLPEERTTVDGLSFVVGYASADGYAVGHRLCLQGENQKGEKEWENGFHGVMVVLYQGV